MVPAVIGESIKTLEPLQSKKSVLNGMSWFLTIVFYNLELSHLSNKSSEAPKTCYAQRPASFRWYQYDTPSLFSYLNFSNFIVFSCHKNCSYRRKLEELSIDIKGQIYFSRVTHRNKGLAVFTDRKDSILSASVKLSVSVETSDRFLLVALDKPIGVFN